METVKQKETKSFKDLKEKFGYKNLMSAPHLVKVVISVGTGTAIKKDKNVNEFIIGRLAKIIGQKPAIRKAKKSVASFKLREGDEIGVMATIRGARMYSFLDKLINIAIPRTKDFRGLSRTSIDDIGNITFAIREHTIFPETTDEELKDVFGFAVTIVTTAKTKKEAEAFFDAIGIPFKK